MTNREFLTQAGYQSANLTVFYDGADVYRIECEGIYLGLTEAPNESTALLNWLNDEAMQGR